MKRRKFIQATLLTAAIPAAGAERLYGKPASLIPNGGKTGGKFLLPLSRSGLPPSTWNEFASVSQIIENVLTSKEEARIFFRDPKTYFGAKGLDASDKTLVDDSVIMLTCLAHPGVQESFAKSDYDSTLEYFKAAGLFEPRDPSVLGERVEALIRQNMAEIRQIVNSSSTELRPDQERMLLDILEQSGVQVTEDEFAIVAQLVASGGVTPMACSAIAACVVAVAIVAIAAAYISVTVGVTVGLMAGLVVSIGVKLAVFVDGETDPQLVKGSQVADAPFTGALAKLDPALIRNAERAARMGAIVGDPGLQRHVVKGMIAEEVGAFMKAMQKTQLLPIDDEHLKLATSATTSYALRFLGI